VQDIPRYWMLDAGSWMLVTGYWILDKTSNDFFLFIPAKDGISTVFQPASSI
jgi:hypothetical protein